VKNEQKMMKSAKKRLKMWKVTKSDEKRTEKSAEKLYLILGPV
jgi:hypothetical protein